MDADAFETDSLEPVVEVVWDAFDLIRLTCPDALMRHGWNRPISIVFS